MFTKAKDVEPPKVSSDPLDELKEAIAFAIAELAREYSVLAKARLDPQPISDANLQALGVADIPAKVKAKLTTVDLAEWRIAYWEAAQDRLWDRYKELNSGKANQFGSARV